MTLNEDIRMASLEALLPDDLEKHVQLNRGRLVTYEALRGEVVLYAEARGTSAKAPKAQDSHRDDPMDTSSLAKGKSKGKGSGSDKVCHNCGKKGHFARDCWAPAKKAETNPKTTAECHKCGKKGHFAKDCWSKGGGKAGQGKGKGSGKRDASALGEEEEPEDEVGMFDISPMGHSPGPEGCTLGWVKVNLDTGAARSVFPEDVKYGERTEEDSINFKTATGEIVPSKGGLVVLARDEWGRRTRFTGLRAPVHKPLLAAGQVTDKGNSVWLSGDRGHIVEKDSHVQRCMQKAFDEAMKETNGRGTLEVYKERGIYNLYVQAEAPTAAPGSGATLDLCVGTSSDSRAAPQVSGGPRQGLGL